MNSWPRNLKDQFRTLVVGVVAILTLPVVDAGADEGGGARVGAGAHQITVQDLQGGVLAGSFGGIDDAGRLMFVSGDGASDRLDPSDIERVVFAPGGQSESQRLVMDDAPVADATAAEVQFEFKDQGHLRASVVRSADDIVFLSHRLLGGCRIATGDLSAVRFVDAGLNFEAEQLFQTERAEAHAGVDVLISLRNGQVRGVRGVLAALGPASGEFLFRGEPRLFRYEHTYAVVLAAGAPSPHEASARSKAVLIDGTTLPGSPDLSDADQLSWRLPSGHALALPVEALAMLEFASDRIVYVSDLTPVDEEIATILQVEPWPVRRDRSAVNRPMAMNGQSYRRGVGVHARSALTYALGGEYALFAATIGIDDSVRPGGDVVFQVIGDGRILFDSGGITGHDAARAIRTDVTGIARLTLLVDFGNELDIGDVANWADARLIRHIDRQSASGDRR